MQDELDLGVLHIDMGGGTTSASIFYEGQPLFTPLCRWVGGILPHDIAHGLNVSGLPPSALKRFMAALWRRRGEREQFEVPVIGGDYQTLPRSELTKIIRPRLEETFELGQSTPVASGMANLPVVVWF